MNTPRKITMMAILLSLILLLGTGLAAPQSAWASMEDAALFYEELSQYGDWVEYQNYGPVWYPTKVQENWRPYVDGRWTPSEEGHVFETQEPWGWATYHYGNWMPTEEYGWVWVPGRTWYPNTVTWRTSPDSEAPEASYIGWAPIPPPNYTPPPGYYPEGYAGGGPYSGPFESLITAPFWIFVKAAGFLLGFGQPFAPAYSYWGCNCLLPPPVVPYYVSRTVIVHNYYSPTYYPVGYITVGRGFYNWGPPVPYLARVTRIKEVTINNYIRQVNIYQRANVVPPPPVLARRAHLREVLPPAVVDRKPMPRPMHVRDVQAARGHLARPNLVHAGIIKSAPPLPGNLPKSHGPQAEGPQWRRGVPGAALPASAMMRPDQRLENNFRKIPADQRLEPVSPRARNWTVPPMPGAKAEQPGAVPPGRKPELATPGPGSAPPPASRAIAPKGPASPALPSTASPGRPPASGQPPVIDKKAPTVEVLRPRGPSAPRTVGSQPPTTPGSPPPGGWSRPETGASGSMTTRPSSGKGRGPQVAPGTPPAVSGTPTGQPQPTIQPPTQTQVRTPRPKRKAGPEQTQGGGPAGPGMTGIQPQPQTTGPQGQSQPQMPRQPRVQPRPQMQPPVQMQQSKPMMPQQPQAQPQPRLQPRPQMRQASPPPPRQVQAPPRAPQPAPQAQQKSQAPQRQKGDKSKPNRRTVRPLAVRPGGFIFPGKRGMF